MTNLNIFLENTYENYKKIDEVNIYNNVVKIADYIFKNPEIMTKSCLSGKGYETVSFDIVLVNNEEIHRINKEYRQIDKPTDVITFAIFADSAEDEQFIIDGDINLGEIIVSLDRIEEQSKENKVSFNDELYYIIAHGILHLLGYDHQTEAEYNFMVNNQNKAKAVVS